MDKVILSFLLLVSLLVPVASAQSENNPSETKAKKVQLSGMALEIYQAINALRADPKSFLPPLEAMRASFKDKSYFDKNGNENLTFEGVAAVDDAIAALKKQTPLPAISLSEGLILAAEAHLKDITTVDGFGHKGSDGSQPSDRANRFGSAPYGVYENITGVSKTAQEIIIQTLIDDGFPSRGHRKNLLSSDLKHIGIAFGPSKTYGFISITVLASEFSERPTMPPSAPEPKPKVQAVKPTPATTKSVPVQRSKPAAKPRTRDRR